MSVWGYFQGNGSSKFRLFKHFTGFLRPLLVYDQSIINILFYKYVYKLIPKSTQKNEEKLEKLDALK